MKVAILGPDDGHTSLYIRRAFQKLGHEATIFDYRSKSVAHLPPAEFYLILKGEIFKPAFFKRLKRDGIKHALWNFDSWYAWDKNLLDQAKAADAFFTPSGGLIDEYRKQGINAHYLPEAADLELHHVCGVGHPLWPMTQEEHDFYAADVTFIGTVEGVPERDEWLQAVGEWCDANKHVLKIWGSFPGVKSKKWHMGMRAGPSEPSSQVVIKETEDAIHNKIVSASKVVLDRTRTPGIRGAISARVYRTLAAQGYLVMRHVEGIEESFTPGWSLVTYRDTPGCLYQIEHALGKEIVNPTDREFRTNTGSVRAPIARHGFESVQARHQWVHRVQKLLEIVKA